jgi:ABC-type glutathione transport system ATPase component
MAGTGGRAGPAGCWLAWTTTALSRSGTCGGATAARAGGALMRVRGVTFSVRRGELFALLGTNGA